MKYYFTFPTSLGPGCRATEHGKLSGNLKHKNERFNLNSSQEFKKTTAFLSQREFRVSQGFRFGIRWVDGRLLFPVHLKEKGEGVVSQLPEESLLDLGVSQLLFVLQLGVHLPRHHKEVPPKGHAHHIHVLAAIPERARHHHVD